MPQRSATLQTLDLRSSITFRREAPPLAIFAFCYRSSRSAHHTYPFLLMARHRKNRTHLKGGVASNPGAAEGVPKSFVIKHGQVGTSLTQLVRDVRRVMEPYTASRLKVRRF